MNTLEKIRNNIDNLIKYETPLYVYDYDIINKRCKDMKKLKENLEKRLKIKVNMHYSPKANNNPFVSYGRETQANDLFLFRWYLMLIDICCAYASHILK